MRRAGNADRCVEAFGQGYDFDCARSPPSMSMQLAELRSQLAAFSADHESEVEARAEMLALIRSSDAMSRYHYEPGHMTASGFVLDPAGLAVALVDHPKIGMWLQPGGHVEPDDPNLESAARREVEEETGLTDLTSLGLFDLDIHTFPGHGDQPTHLHFDVRFAFRSASTEIHAGEHDASWIPLGEVSRWNDDASVLRPVGKLQTMVGEMA